MYVNNVSLLHKEGEKVDNSTVVNSHVSQKNFNVKPVQLMKALSCSLLSKKNSTPGANRICYKSNIRDRRYVFRDCPTFDPRYVCATVTGKTKSPIILPHRQKRVVSAQCMPQVKIRNRSDTQIVNSKLNVTQFLSEYSDFDRTSQIGKENLENKSLDKIKGQSFAQSRTKNNDVLCSNSGVPKDNFLSVSNSIQEIINGTCLLLCMSNTDCALLPKKTPSKLTTLTCTEISSNRFGTLSSGKLENLNKITNRNSRTELIQCSKKMNASKSLQIPAGSAAKYSSSKPTENVSRSSITTHSGTLRRSLSSASVFADELW